MITCTNCGFAENPDQARFCAQCATSLVAVEAIAAQPTPGIPIEDRAPPSPAQEVEETEVASVSLDVQTVPELDSQRGQTLAVDTVLQGHYTVLRKLSEGGMGAVYLAQDTRLFNKLCVVKEMLPFYTTDAERRIAERNFEREARTLAHLRHPGIPEIYDFFVEQDRYYLVMAFVEGDDLGKVLAQRGQPFEQDEIGRYGMQLARVLDYLADRNPPVMHRDIKPGNIILEKTTGQLKLVDFGIARDSLGSENLEATGSIVMGTRGYAPPEQFAGKATPTSDIYAMGATLHHLATGQHPLKASVPFQFASVRTIRPEFSPALDALLLETVRIDPAQRPNAADLKKRFERLSGTQVAQNAFVMRNGAEVFSAGELVQACERSPETGRYHLVQGHIRDWFLSQKRHDLAGWADECVAEAPDDRIALEWFLRMLDPTLPAPQMKLDEEFIDFGEVERDSSYTLLVPFTNATRGYLVAAAGSHVPWLRVETEYAGCYVGEQGQIQVTLDTHNMPEGMHTRDALALAWEDQQRIVPTRLVVTWPPGGQMMPQSLEFDIFSDDAARPMQHLSLRNTGGSDWVGRVQSDASWLIVQGSTFRIPSQRELNLPVGVNPQRLELAEPTHGRIALISNGGSQVTTASARLVKPWYTGRGRLRRWLAFAAPTLLSVVGLSVGMAYLATALLHLKDSPSGQLVNAAIGLAAWILGLLVAGVFVPPINELENFHHGGDLTLDVPVSRFVRSRALITIGVGVVAGLIVGVNYGSGMPEAGLGRVASILAGMLLGGLAGLLARVGSNDYLLGTRIAPGLNWFVRHPALLALSRTALTSLSLALLGVMLGGEGELIYPVTAALAGLILTSDGYPYLPTRLRQWLSWIRPAALVIATSYAVMLILFQLAGRPVLAMDGINQRVIIFSGLLLMARLGGAVLGIASVDEVGYNWQRELRQSSLLGLILLVAAAAVYWLASGLIEALTGSGAREVSQAVTLVLVTLLALGLTGRSQQLRQWMQRGQSGAGRWLQQYEISQQAQGLVEQQASQLQRFSGDILVSTSHPITLASMAAIAVLCAPSVARLFGAVLWLAVLAAAAAVGLWYYRKRSAAAAAMGGGQ